MNAWQTARQIRYLLQQEQWGGTTDVFDDDSVRIITAGSESAFEDLINPAVLIRIEEAEMDPEFGEQPGLIRQTLSLTLCVSNDGDGYGTSPLIGAGRTGQTDSRGRGLLELEEPLMNAVERLGDADGNRIVCRAATVAGTVAHADYSHMAFREYRLEAWVTSDRYYHPPTRLTATKNGADVDLTWSLPPDRYDRLRMVLRRASGATAPASASAGTGVTLGSDLATSVTDTNPGSGQWSYALFAAYSEFDASPAAEDRYSAADTATVTV